MEVIICWLWHQCYVIRASGGSTVSHELGVEDGGGGGGSPSAVLYWCYTTPWLGSTSLQRTWDHWVWSKKKTSQIRAKQWCDYDLFPYNMWRTGASKELHFLFARLHHRIGAAAWPGFFYSFIHSSYLQYVLFNQAGYHWEHQRTWRKPIQTPGDHVKFHKHSSLSSGWNQESWSFRQQKISFISWCKTNGHMTWSHYCVVLLIIPYCSKYLQHHDLIQSEHDISDYMHRNYIP